MQIEETTYGHPLWDRTMAFAEMCFWCTGRYLAKKMRENGFEPNERVLAARMADRRSLQGGKDAGLFNSYLMSGEIGLYEKYGFQKMGEYETIYHTTDQLFSRAL